MLRRLKSWFSRNGLGLTLLGLILALVFAWLTPTIFIFVPSGHIGVYWVRFGSGTITDRVLNEGVAYKWPWDKIYLYDARLQVVDYPFEVLTSDGLEAIVDISTRYRLIREDIALLHKNIGPDYVKTLLLPEVNSHARHEISKYTPEELYSLKRIEIEQAIVEGLKNAMRFEYEPENDRESFLYIENILLKRTQLPTKVQEAIQDKLVQFYLMQGYDFRVAREEKERLRKRVEAQGIRDFQTIVNEGISEQYLKWKGISATLALATSNNAKVVVIGAGEGGLPIILGNIDSPPAVPPGGDRASANQQIDQAAQSDLSLALESDPLLSPEPEIPNPSEALLPPPHVDDNDSADQSESVKKSQ